MEINNELIKRFLKNECSGEEAEFFQEYFENHPEEIEKYIPLKDLLASNEYRLNPTVSERILQHIREKYKKKKVVPIKKYLAKYAVAASLIGIIIFGAIKLFTGTEKNIPENVIAMNKNIDSTQELKMIENKTDKAVKDTLSDGSVVTIYPNSSLKYLPLFDHNRRELYLTGKAHFKVFKDTSRPFTVYVSDIATTDLGTSFIISELKGKRVSVNLLEGRVKVWQTSTNGTKFVLLLSGDEVIVNNGRFDNYILSHKTATSKASKFADMVVGNDKVKNNTGLAFKNTPLKEVFKKIEEKFGVIIDYEATTGIDEKLFTGKFYETDNLEFICKIICNSNGLTYSITEKRVTISSQ